MRIILSSLTSSQDFCEDNTYIHICVYLHILYIRYFVATVSPEPVLLYLWEWFGPFFFRVKPLTVTISIIQGGFEEDTRKMCVKCNLQTKMKQYDHWITSLLVTSFRKHYKGKLVAVPDSVYSHPTLTKALSWAVSAILWAIAAVSTFCPLTWAEGDFRVVISEFPVPWRKLYF